MTNKENATVHSNTEMDPILRIPITYTVRYGTIKSSSSRYPIHLEILKFEINSITTSYHKNIKELFVDDIVVSLGITLFQMFGTTFISKLPKFTNYFELLYNKTTSDLPERNRELETNIIGNEHVLKHLLMNVKFVKTE